MKFIKRIVDGISDSDSEIIEDVQYDLLKELGYSNPKKTWDDYFQPMEAIFQVTRDCEVSDNPFSKFDARLETKEFVRQNYQDAESVIASRDWHPASKGSYVYLEPEDGELYVFPDKQAALTFVKETIDQGSSDEVEDAAEVKSFSKAREFLGDTAIVDELQQYLSTDELKEFSDHLFRNFDLDSAVEDSSEVSLSGEDRAKHLLDRANRLKEEADSLLDQAKSDPSLMNQAVAKKAMYKDALALYEKVKQSK